MACALGKMAAATVFPSSPTSRVPAKLNLINYAVGGALWLDSDVSGV